MKTRLTALTASLTPTKVRFALFVLTIAMFVLGAGAPDAGGGHIR